MTLLFIQYPELRVGFLQAKREIHQAGVPYGEYQSDLASSPHIFLKAASYPLSISGFNSVEAERSFSLSISGSIGSNHTLTSFSGCKRRSSVKKWANASHMVRTSSASSRSSSARQPRNSPLASSRPPVILRRLCSSRSISDSSSISFHPGGSPILPAASQARLEPAWWPSR